MVTPTKGDTGGVPLNAEGRRVAGEWDPARDAAAGEACRAYGAPGLMRLPGRLHITWQDDRTLKIEADAGTQTRLLHFGGGAPAAAGDRAWQGISTRRVGCRAGWRSVRAALGLAACGDDATAARLPAQERRPLQRADRAHRVLRPASRSARCDMDHDHDDRQRSEVPRRRNSSPAPTSGKSRTARNGARRHARPTNCARVRARVGLRRGGAPPRRSGCRSRFPAPRVMLTRLPT